MTVTVPAQHSATPPAATSPGTDDRQQPVPRRSIGPLLLRLHFYAGVLIAPFLALLALTGLAYAFAPQIDEIAYHDHLHVDTVATTTVPLSAQVTAAQAAVPGGLLAQIEPAAVPNATTKVTFNVEGLGDEQRTAYIDPYTGRLRGVLTTSSGSTPATTWLGQMHSNLNLGEPGRVYSELAASWLWVLVLSGVMMWWRHQRGKRRARTLLLPAGGSRPGVRRTRSWHATTGLWAATALLFLSATGLTWSQYAGENFSALRTVLNSDSVPLDTALTSATVGAEAEHHGGHIAGTAAGDIDAVAAATAFAGLGGPTTIVPGDVGRAWTVQQVDNTWPVHRDKIAVHPQSGQILDTVRWDEQPLLSQLTTLGIQAHMGVLFGLPNQLMLAAVALGLLAVIFWGYWMWWQRRPTRTERRRPFGTPPARGAWRAPSWPNLVALAAVTIAVGWAMPLLGLSLTAFLLVDAAGAAIRRLRG